MRKQGLADGDGEAATAVAENGHSFPQVCRMTVLPSHAHLQETVDGVDVVVTTPGRGTFLIRGRKHHPRSPCPFLRCEIRRISADAPGREDPDRADPPPVCRADDARRREAFGHEPAGGTQYPHWKFALQLVEDPLLNSAPRKAE